MTIVEKEENNTIEQVGEQSSFELEKTTPYMLRNDGELLKCGDVHPYIKVYFNGDYETNLAELLKHPHWLKWYSENSKNAETKDLIDKLIDQPTEEVYNKLNTLMNKEFCKVRTTNIKYKYGPDNGEIYFRLCDSTTNWFDIIWKVVADFSKDIKFITIVWDYQTFGKQFDYCIYKNYIFNKMPVEEFLTIEGNPVLTLKKILPEN